MGASVDVVFRKIGSVESGIYNYKTVVYYCQIQVRENT